MSLVDATGEVWRKSTRSGNADNCVEVATNLLERTGHVLMGDSKDPDGPVLAFARPEWEALTGGAADGEFACSERRGRA